MVLSPSLYSFHQKEENPDTGVEIMQINITEETARAIILLDDDTTLTYSKALEQTQKRSTS